RPIPFSEFPSLLNPRFMAGMRRPLPSGLYKRLDPFEAPIEMFVRNVAAQIPPGKRVLDAGAGAGRFNSFFAHTEYLAIDFTQGGWRWLLFPIFAPVFGLVLPLCCYYLDTLDRDRAYTLGFIAEGWKQ